MLKPVGIKEWHDYYRMTETASYFQSPGWSELWNRYTNGQFRGEPLLAELPSGKTVLIPLTRQSLRGRAGSIWHAAPAGTYGGWLAEPGVVLTVEEAMMLIKELFTYCGSLTYRLFPMTPVGDENRPVSSLDIRNLLKNSFDSLHQTAIIDDHTRFIDCANGYDAILRSWAAGKGSMKAKLNKAERAGVHIRRLATEQDLELYYDLYQSALQRWTPPPAHIYSRIYFELIMATGNRSAHGTGKREDFNPDRVDSSRQVWLAEYDKKIIAGAIILTGNQHMTYWHGVSDPAYQSLRPVNLLIATLIKHCCSSGLRWFDFNPSMGITGVDRFKQSFGALQAHCPVLEKRTIGVRISTFAGKLLSRLYKKDPG